MARALVSLIAIAVCGTALAACGGTERSETSPGESRSAAPAFKTTTPEAIGDRVAAREVLLVDVREDEEWQAGRAPDAVHVPLAGVEGRLDEIGERAAGRPVAFICRTGRRSAEAAQTAVDGGLDGVINVDGGMEAWAQAGLPLRPRDGEIV